MMPSAVPHPSDPDPCDVCGAHTFEPWVEVSLCGAFDRWIQRCRACGFRQVRPRLTRGELRSLYPAGYFGAAEGIGYGDYAREAQRRVRDAYFLLPRIRRHGPGARVLEVGCALGFLLAALRDAGCAVEGVDASPFAVFYATTRLGLPVTCGTLEDAQFPQAAFDVVVQKDLLEHTLHPRTHLLETARVMRHGAELWLITPNGEANLRPIQSSRRAAEAGDDLPLLDQGHLSFFSLRHLEQLFTECGFETVRAREIGVRRGLRALGLWPGRRRSARRAPRARAVAGPASDEHPVGGDDRFAEHADRIAAAVRDHESWLRRWPLYYYAHRLGKRIDMLPAGAQVGYDFEFLLRKR